MKPNSAFGLIYTGESNMRLRDLTYSRSVAAVPFAGRYRCIDFVMSCLVNSGISNVGLIAQKNYHSLMDHLGSGKEWDLHRKRDGLFILPPFVTRDNTGIYRGTVDAFRSVMGYVRRSSQRFVIVTGSHTIYNTTFDAMMQQHIDTGADITIMYTDERREFSPDDQYDDLRLTLDERGLITDLMLNPSHPSSTFLSADAFIMDKTMFEYLVEEASAHADTDFIRDVIVKSVHSLRMYGWKYDGYVARLNSLGCFFRHNMDTLDKAVRQDLFNPAHPIYTKVKDEVPAIYGANSGISRSLVADGCYIDGQVENCVLFRGVRIGAGAHITNSIIMQGCEIGAGCELDHVVLDKGVTVRAGRRLAGFESFPVTIRKNVTV